MWSATDHPPDDPIHREFIDFYEEMLGSGEFYWFTIEAAPPDSMHYLTAAEIDRFHLVEQKQ